MKELTVTCPKCDARITLALECSRRPGPELRCYACGMKLDMPNYAPEPEPPETEIFRMKDWEASHAG